MFGRERGSGDEAGMTQKTGTNEEREDVESEGQSLGLGSQLFALYSSTGDSPSLISVAYWVS